MAKPIMIQGTMSNAGKSLLRRHYAAFLSRTDTALLRLSHRIWRSIHILPLTV